MNRFSRSIEGRGRRVAPAVTGLFLLALLPFRGEGQEIIPPGMLHPGPDASEYAGRRAALAASLPGDGVFVSFGSPEPTADYLPYSQDPNFRYLTGITEPSSSLVIVRSGGRSEEILFVRTRNPSRELWEGSRLGQDGATAVTGIPARSSLEFASVLDSLIGAHGTLFTLEDVAPTSSIRLEENLSYGKQLLSRILEARPGTEVRMVTSNLSRIRAQKSEREIDLIRRSVYISALAHREAMKAIRPGMNEFEIRALVEYFFLRNGAEGPAYSSIVGSGPNATTLHYRAADRYMGDGELLLFDVASSYRGYAADITRTVPVNGRFTPEQREVYEIVLAAQKAAEALFREGITWREMNEAANTVLSEGLARIGLIDAPDAEYDCGENRRCPQYRLWYMHGLGHGVGMAVHDPDLAAFGGFGPGTAITIEPGIYIRDDALVHLPDTPGNREWIERIRAAHETYRNIGVRIEDVFILDANGVERASAAAPRDVEEVEALMRESGFGGDRIPEMVEWYRTTGLVPPDGE